MRPISPELLQYLSSIFQVGERRPSCAVFLFHPITNEKMRLDRIVTVDLDRRYDSSADEFVVVAENAGGWLSPDYAANKFPGTQLFNRGVPESNPWPGVLQANTKVEVWLGYGQHMIKKITGLIDGVTVGATGKTISIKGRSMYKRMLVETVKTSSLAMEILYENKSLRYIVEDVHFRAGIPITADEIFVTGTASIYMVPKLELSRGNSWDSYIHDLVDSAYARIFNDADGNSLLKTIPIHSQGDPEDFVLHEAVNLTELEYNMEDFDIKGNLIIRYTDEVMSAFEDSYLKTIFLRGQFREEIIDVPWANSFEKRTQAALSQFRKYKQKIRSLTVGCVGNPAIDIYDLCRVHEQISTATGKYSVKAIRSSFSSRGYFELMDLEYAI